MLKLKHKKCGEKLVRVSKLGLASGLMVFLTLVSGLVLTSSSIKADENRGDNEVSCTLSYENDNTHKSIIRIGSYKTDIGVATLDTSCNDTSGFSIYTVGFTGDEFGNTNMVAPADAINYAESIATGTATEGDVSAWAVKADVLAGNSAPIIDNGFDSYRTIPDDYTRLAYLTNETDNAEGASLRLSYAVYISDAQMSGTYAGKVRYILVHPHNEYPCGYKKICYKENGDNAIGGMGKQDVSGENRAMLWASNYSREGYGFAGWNTEPDGSGTSYGPNETITFPSDAIDGLTLYAMWVAPAKDSLGNSLTFQTIELMNVTLQDGTTLSDKPIGYVTALIDKRDNDVYAIAKLADGNYWMIENLRLDYDADFTESLSQGFGKSTSYGNFVGLAEPESKNIADSYEANSIYCVNLGCNDSTATMDIDFAYAQYRFPRYNNTNTSNRTSIMTSPRWNIYSYGNYYTWAAAMANTQRYGGPAGKDENGRTSESVGTSICPAGWRLPQGRNIGNGAKSGSFSYLDKQLGGDGDWHLSESPVWRTYPNNFVFSGVYREGYQGYGGEDSGYWSSTAGGEDWAYIHGSGLNMHDPGLGGVDKFYGLSVRCLMSTVRWYDVEVDFDDKVSSVTIDSDFYGYYTVETSGQSVRLADGISYNISATYVTDIDKFSSWTTTENGTLGSSSSEETTYVVNDTATLTLASKEVCPTGRICYRNSGADNATAAALQSVSDGATSVNLRVPNFKRSGYGFAGWNTKLDGSGVTYGPNEAIVFDPTAEEGLILYPKWVASAGSLQDWSCPSEALMPVGTVTALTDGRDGDTYAVAKLADGKCWMIENMRLDFEDSIGNENKALSQGYGSGFTGLAEPETNNFMDSTTPNSLYTTDIAATTLNVIAGDNLGSRFPRYRNDNTNTLAAGVVAVASRRAYGYGNYYTYAATIADIGDHTNNGESSTTSICPAGWRLPIGGTKDSNNDYWELVVNKLNGGVLPTGSGGGIYDGDSEGAEVSKKVREFPNNFVTSGYAYNGSTMNGRGNRGDYWSATTSSGTTAYRFSFREQGVNPGMVSLEKYDGLAVRCVSENTTIDGYSYMQDFAGLTEEEKGEVLDSMVTGEQYVLMDSRDNKKYYISKLADGNVWMTQNLDFDIVNGGANINSANTDVPVDWEDVGNLTNTYATSDLTWEGSMERPESYDPGDVCWDGVITTDQFQTLSDRSEACNQSNNHYHIGNYYNWTAALAMGNSSSYSTSETDVEQSICPAGWTLPSSGSNTNSGSFAYLANETGLSSGDSGNAHVSPTYFSYGGSWQGNSVFVGYGGFYWSSTAKSNEYAAYSLNITPYIALPNGNSERFSGNLVRCVVRTQNP